ncbi:LOW QUALITY PROTEIN: dapper homolog 3 [Suncus etruscus]|uniref:LOW QUALITY PROTEIN: dapper homolog 3 n=1 Tax=Suncus etruscus TaxID=109475 RepID=UPI00210F545C|nr:LOW QUALITY PROTEIN: dapper homolog 3 [Suncus etruscus]
MIRAFSFPVSPERGRLRGWLEGSLAGLCELHWLRERQEYRVQQALRLAQPGLGGAEAEDDEDADEDEDAAAARRAAAALEEQLEALPGLIWGLEQQLGDLSLESGGLEQESGRSSGFYEDPSSTAGPDSPPSTFCGDSGFSGSSSYGRLGPCEPRGIYASERPKSLGDACPSAPEVVSARPAVPRSYSAPYPTAAAGPEGCSSADRRARAGPFLSPSPLHAVALRSPRPCGRPLASVASVAADSSDPGRPLDGYITALLRRRRRRGAGQPRTSPGGADGGPRRQNSVRQRVPDAASPPPGGARSAQELPGGGANAGGALERPGARPNSPAPLGRGAWGSPWEAEAAPEPPGAPPAAPEPPDSPADGRLVKAQYIPAAQAATRGLPGRAARRKAPPPLTRGRSVEQSPAPERERPRVSAGRRGRLAEAQGRTGGSPRARKAARSQSETSLLGTAAAAAPPGPPKYPTAERDEPRPPRPRRGPAPTLAAQAAGSCRRWRSTAEIDAPRRSARAPGPVRPRHRGPGPGPSPQVPPRRLLYGCAGSDSECSTGRLGGPLGRRGPAGGGGAGWLGRRLRRRSESSASDGESPAFSSASSDSDGSGGLVWPQQLVAATTAAAAAAAAGPGPGVGGGTPAGPAKVFVKIKASHALKKKILRFRSGSLKVMTTV